MARWASPAHCSASCTDCAKGSPGKGGANEMHPLEASRALKRISAHIQMADGAGVPGVRMIADGAWVRMDIATNKEQCQDKETPKGGPVNKKKKEPPSCDRSTGGPAKKQSETMGATFRSSPSRDLSCHFDPSPLGRGLHHHVEVAGRWCRPAGRVEILRPAGQAG